MKILNENLNRDLIIGIDFDGTITDSNIYPDIGNMREGASEYINKWKSLGYYIIIWTCRSNQLDIADMILFLRKNNIPFDAINNNSPQLDFQPYPKIFYNFLLDDRSIPPFSGFKEADRLIMEQVNG